jgi:solute:Na+ symporter, SSS family
MMMIGEMMMVEAEARLRGADLFILIGYFVLMFGIGAYFYRHIRQMKDFFSGGNKIPWWLSGVSYYMSCFSAFAFITYSAMAYQFGWVAVTLFWIMAPATLASVLFFASKWRRARINSPVEYLEERYGPLLRQLFAWEGIPMKIFDDGLKLVAIGIFMSEGLKMDMGPSMLWAGLVMLAYTYMGGLWAVMVTDFLQFLVMISGVIVLAILAVVEAGGLGNMIRSAPADFFKPIHPPQYGWLYIASNIFLFCLAFSSINWALIQRYYCVAKESDAKKVGWLVVVLSIIGPPLILLPALAARTFMPGIEQSKQVYPLLCMKLLPAGMLGLVVAALFASTMAMLSSNYNVCASVMTNDIYRRYIRPNASQRELVHVGRINTLIVGITSLAAAFLFAKASGEGLFRSMVKIFAITTPPVALPMIAGLFTRRFTNKGALAGFVAGVASGVTMLLACPSSFEFLGAAWKVENLITWGGAAVTLVTMTLVSFFDHQSPVERERIEAFLHRLTVPIGQAEADKPAPSDSGDHPETGGISPFRVVGVSIMIIAALMLAVAPAVGHGLAVTVDLTVGLVLLAIGTMVTFIHRFRRTRVANETKSD